MASEAEKYEVLERIGAHTSPPAFNAGTEPCVADQILQDKALLALFTKCAGRLTDLYVEIGHFDYRLY